MTPLRWRVAGTLDRSSRFCWADLVSWAQRSRTLREAVTGSRCEAESRTHRDRSCYCGKFDNGCRRVGPVTPEDPKEARR